MSTTAKDKKLATRQQLATIRERRSHVVVEECILESDNHTLRVVYFFDNDPDTVECEEILLPYDKWSHICENKVCRWSTFYQDHVSVEWSSVSFSPELDGPEENSGKENLDFEDFVNTYLSDSKVARDLLLEWVELDGSDDDTPAEDPRYLLSQLKELLAADDEKITGRAIAALTPHSYNTYLNYLRGEIGDTNTLKDFIRAAQVLAAKKKKRFNAIPII